MEKLRFIDTHTHPYDEAFDEDRKEALQRALDAGVEMWIFPGIDISTYKSQRELALSYKGNAFMAMGLHPTSVSANWKEELEFALKKLEEDGDYVAVGEIGLDGYWSREFMDEQKQVLEAQLDYAVSKSLPVIIHERSTTEEMLDIMEKYRGKLFGVFHAFTGSIETYRRIHRLGGFKVGIGGVVTFKNAGVAKTVVDIPLEEILLETDSPWLTPAPHRGTRNESSYIPLIANKIAECKNLSLSQVAEVTTRNAEELFKL
ncbi:MAG: TatD family hydrolase [Bacteroidales bacterium]|nr:TatD family hydrolase [Bacteroidales bacterium]